nr:proton-conducting transporter membrane subunit [Alkalilimnicola ehrlichii]
MLLSQGFDRLARLGGASRETAVLWLAVCLAMASLVGLPPTGGFVGKWWLLQAALSVDAWLWALAIVAGSFLTIIYLLRVLEVVARPVAPVAGAGVSGLLSGSALALALAAVGLGLLALLLEPGRLPFGEFG